MKHQPCHLVNNTAVVLGLDTIAHIHQLENGGRKLAGISAKVSMRSDVTIANQPN